MVHAAQRDKKSLALLGHTFINWENLLNRLHQRHYINALINFN